MCSYYKLQTSQVKGDKPPPKPPQPTGAPIKP
jgi:hypothetical protein